MVTWSRSMPGTGGDIRCAKMNNKPELLYLERLMRSITAFQAALQGPDPEGADQDAPIMDQYLIVLQGQKMNLHGWADGHPKLGKTFIHTSLLIHISEDRKWARTLSRWYQLGDAQQMDTSQLSPDIDLASFCTPVGLAGVSIPLYLARRVMGLQPTRLAGIARERGFGDVAATLSEIGKSWPPKV